jgi:Flp pilus assembly protein TadB
MLTPLSTMACDGARTQAFQRFSGWTWFMAGLTFAMVWLVMPLDVAKPLSIVVIVAGMLLVATQLIRMARRHRREA